MRCLKGFTRALALLGLSAAIEPALRAEPPVHAEPTAAEQPTPLEVTIVGGPELNPNTAGRASPVVVRVFDLTATPAFQAADFQTLFEHPADALKGALVAQEEFVLRPGDVQERSRVTQPRVVALGVAAAFRDVDHGIWHLVVPVDAGRRNFLLIDLNRNTIRLETVDSGHP